MKNTFLLITFFILCYGVSRCYFNVNAQTQIPLEGQSKLQTKTTETKSFIPVQSMNDDHSQQPASPWAAQPQTPVITSHSQKSSTIKLAKNLEELIEFLQDAKFNRDYRTPFSSDYFYNEGLIKAIRERPNDRDILYMTRLAFLRNALYAENFAEVERRIKELDGMNDGKPDWQGRFARSINDELIQFIAPGKFNWKPDKNLDPDKYLRIASLMIRDKQDYEFQTPIRFAADIYVTRGEFEKAVVLYENTFPKTTALRMIFGAVELEYQQLQNRDLLKQRYTDLVAKLLKAREVQSDSQVQGHVAISSNDSPEQTVKWIISRCFERDMDTMAFELLDSWLSPNWTVGSIFDKTGKIA